LERRAEGARLAIAARDRNASFTESAVWEQLGNFRVKDGDVRVLSDPSGPRGNLRWGTRLPERHN
jgi:hypothetical protein